MSLFDEDLFLKGLAQRKGTLGEAHVDRTMAAADDFSRPFQEAMTAWCWGFGWGDEALPPKTRSMLTLAMLAALDKPEEFKLHLRGARRNGVSEEELRALLHAIAIYCGVPQGVACFRLAREVMTEETD